jgi:hypothetical protein
LSRSGRYDYALPFERKKSKKQMQAIKNDVDKVKVAKAICRGKADLRVLDLEKRVSDLVRMIQSANA